MNRPTIPILTLILTVLGPAARADSPATEAASRAWAIADVVLARNVDPPTRQQMILGGLKAVAKAGHESLPSGLARRVSDLTNADQLASLLAETWANSKLVDPEEREKAFFEGMLSAVPGNARLLSAKERKVEESFEANLYVGIQVALGLDEKARKPVFQQILEGGPADQVGVRAGDIIEEIDGESAEGLPLVQVIKRLRGEEGTDVLVRYRRPQTGEVFTKAMTRGRLFRPTVQGLSPLPEKRWSVRFDGPEPIGYLKIKEVSGSTPRELRAFAEQLESEGVKALVLDLREASTARFHPTVLLADALLDGGVIGRVKAVDGEKAYRAEPDALFRGWPMVVLANSIEEPEIAWLCDALVDNHRATILGKPVISREAHVSEMVALPGDEWSVQMATGVLLRGDGQPLAYQSRRGFGDESAAEIRPAEKAIQGSPRFPFNLPQFGGEVMKKQATHQDLAKAREILAEALKSAGK